MGSVGANNTIDPTVCERPSARSQKKRVIVDVRAHIMHDAVLYFPQIEIQKQRPCLPSVAHGMFESQGDKFRHSPASWLLREDHPSPCVASSGCSVCQ